MLLPSTMSPIFNCAIMHGLSDLAWQDAFKRCAQACASSPKFGMAKHWYAAMEPLPAQQKGLCRHADCELKYSSLENGTLVMKVIDA